ncbi:peptidyl-tRNA hydrolase [Finch poxvirus]|uniref:peptidyl-tRNA hydrolase n=1 Tax=Condorpox virus TaxID=3049970 RepID=A0AAT9UP95_9POXV|nr:peptidyl-tRNA hydrolase [Finch poxvirus]UOX39152.1 peptidyl-tRNA hydrolase [Finch poxvirus]
MATNNVFECTKDALKMVFIIRNDIKMSKSKLISLCVHGAIKAYIKAEEHCTDYLKRWIKAGQLKETVRVEKESKLLDIIDSAKAVDINFYVVRDEETMKINTVLVLGPAPSYLFEPFTKSLKSL